MRKIIVALMVLCLLLAGCAEKTESKMDSYGNIWNDPLTLAAGEFKPLLDLTPEAAHTIELTVLLDELAGDIKLVYIPQEGEAAVLWSSQAPAENAELLEKWQLGSNWLDKVDITEDALLFRLTLEVPPGEGHFAWQAGEEGVSVIPRVLWTGLYGAGVTTVYA
jgi:hypothetical protein